MIEREPGYTLIELMVIIAVIAVIMAIAVPYVLSSTVSANESAAIHSLRAIASAQSQVRINGAIDSDQNGTGEYGFLSELSGTTDVRVDADRDGISDGPGAAALDPNTLPVSFRPQQRGAAVRSGYRFRMMLPGEDMSFVQEFTTRDGAPRLDRVLALGAEGFWCCYAWPVSFGKTGNRAFVVNQLGEVLFCSNAQTRYSGNRGPRPEAAMVPPPPGPAAGWRWGRRNRPTIDGTIAVDAVGSDGNFWKPLR